MKIGAWLLVAVAGWGVMLGAYATRAKTDSQAPWAHSVAVIGPDLPGDLAQVGHQTKLRLRLLPSNERTESIISGVSLVRPNLADKLELELRPKLYQLPAEEGRIDASSLKSGRLPLVGRDEVIAGAWAAHRDRLTVGDRVLEVVGVLKAGPGLLSDSYLIPPSDHGDVLFGDNEPSVRKATLLQLTPQELGDRELAAKLEKQLPPATFKLLMPIDRLEQRTAYFYLGGLALFLLGGSGALIRLFRDLAARARQPREGYAHGQTVFEGDAGLIKQRPRWWAIPLIEMDERPRLVWGVHLAYFGLVIVGSLLVFWLPEVQTILLSETRQALGASSGPLAQAAKAYQSGNILYAAAVTFVINFLLGSLLMLTVPSVIVPGSGIFLAATRGFLWGLIFSPTSGELTYKMLPHSGTMLLEGEGYILAVLFGLLVPIHLMQSSLGGNLISRFGRVVWLNVLANFWVAVVLVVAACYEAFEVISINR